MIAQKMSAPAMLPVAGLKAWEIIAAKSAHLLLLALMLLIPATGYLISTSAGDGVSIFGLFSVPALLNISEKIRDAAVSGHYWLAYSGALLALIHAATAKTSFLRQKRSIAAHVAKLNPPLSKNLGALKFGRKD